jgi:hypothetical protein
MARASERLDPDVERDLVKALAEATLVVPMRDGGLWATADGEERTQVVAFTSPAALEAWTGQSTQHALIPGVELAGIAAATDASALWINPAGPHGGRLDRRMVDVVAAGRAMTLEAMEKGRMTLRTSGAGEVRVRPVQEAPPAEAVARVREAVARAGAISGAWLLEAVQPPPPHLLLVLAVEPAADVDAALAAVRDVAAGLVPPDRFVDVMPVEGGDSERLGQAPILGLALA